MQLITVRSYEHDYPIYTITGVWLVARSTESVRYGTIIFLSYDMSTIFALISWFKLTEKPKLITIASYLI